MNNRLKYYIIILIILCTGQTSLFSQEKNKLGLGIILGEPTGLSVRFLNNFSGGLAWSVDNHFHMHLDYWVYKNSIHKQLNWFIGAGGKLRVFTGQSKNKESKDKKVGVGLRVPVGLQFYVIDRVELFGEIAPGISVYPATDFDIDGGIGARYYFF